MKAKVLILIAICMWLVYLIFVVIPSNEGTIIDYPMDEPTSYSGIVKGINTEGFNVGDTLVLDNGALRAKRPNEIIWKVYMIGTVLAVIDTVNSALSFYIEEDVQLIERKVLECYENEYRNPNIENVDSIIAMMDSLFPPHLEERTRWGSWRRFKHLDINNPPRPSETPITIEGIKK